VTERYRDSNMQTVVLNGLYFPFVDLLSSVALAVVLGYGGYLYFQGNVTLGTLFAFMLYVQNFFDPVQQLSQLYGTFLSATAALDKIVDVLDQEPEVTDRPGALELPHVEGNVAFEDVRFGYGGGPRGRDGRRARLHPPPRGWLRDTARGARHPALAGAAPARRSRPRPARRPAHPDPRRGDLIGGHRHRAQDRTGPADPAGRPDRLRDRPPALDDPC